MTSSPIYTVVDRVNMVQLCMLLGGDYNEGIKGVGVVSAMEILHAFGAKNDALAKFHEFIKNGISLEQDVDVVGYHDEMFLMS